MLFDRTSSTSAPARVVVTGAGIITGLGNGWTENAAGFREGRSAFAPVSLFDASRQRAKQAAEIKDLDSKLPEVSRSARRRFERASKMLLVAGTEAWVQSGWPRGISVPLILGSTSGGMTLGETYYRQALEIPPRRGRQASRVVHYQAQQQGLDLQKSLSFSGPIFIVANACASGANAIGMACDMVRSGQATRVLTGGYDALSHLVFAGFDALQALSTTSCRPFDAHRDGLALGEGAAVLALESLESASKRGAEILGEVAGYGCAMDLHHLTQPHPQGDAALASMEMACQRAGVGPDEIGYINAHGTATSLNDAAETQAINRWAGERAPRMRVSSTKASIGHTLGAAGALEAIVCLMALRHQWLPPMKGVNDPDTACQFNLVREPSNASFDYALTNSFGFGGANATLVLRRWLD